MGCLLASAHCENQIHFNSSPSCLKEFGQSSQERTSQEFAGIKLKCIRQDYERKISFCEIKSFHINYESHKVLMGL